MVFYSPCEGVASAKTRSKSTYWRITPGLLSIARLMQSGERCMESALFQILRYGPAVSGIFYYGGFFAMEWSFGFFFTSIMLGVGLAMDAFSVSLANGLNEAKMRNGKMCGISGVFAFFQGLMPMIGWVCIHTITQYFQSFEKLIPWIALALLGYIGGKMLWEGLHPGSEEEGPKQTNFAALLVQGIATSIDALSVGFTIAEYNWIMALASALIIAGVTFPICYAGIAIGKKAGTKLAGKAGILGGVILIVIGLEIFISSWF